MVGGCARAEHDLGGGHAGGVLSTHPHERSYTAKLIGLFLLECVNPEAGSFRPLSLTPPPGPGCRSLCFIGLSGLTYFVVLVRRFVRSMRE